MSNPGVVRVSALNDYIKALFDKNDVLQNIRVEGEISNFKRHAASGHCYFSIKDEKSAINCVMFRSAAQQLRALPQNGQAVICQGSVFKTEETRRALPRMPKKIGIVTSPTGAVIRDMLRVLRRRWPMSEVLLVPASVQGQEGARSICAGLAALYARDDIDMIIVGRGGGSLEDLWNFNEEPVVRMIAQSPVPIVSAVGHETDVTLADFAADVRAGTPSMAAELAVPDRAQVWREISEARARCEGEVQALLRRKAQVLAGYLSGSLLQDPARLLASYHLTLDQRWAELDKALQQTMNDKQKRFSENISTLDALSPLKVLARGYSFCEKEGVAVRSTSQLAVGDALTLHFADGAASCTTTSIDQKRDEQ